MLLWLKKAKWNFKIVFWSSGWEIPHAISEFNLFCEGLHPAFNGENGTHKVLLNDQKGPDLRVKDKNVGMFYKFGPFTSNICLVNGSLERKAGENTQDLV